MPPRIESITIDDHILEKIESKHGVSFEEIEETCLSEERYVRRGREGLFELFGQAEEGRYLAVLPANLGDGLWRVVTAREMTDKEKRLYVRTKRNR